MENRPVSGQEFKDSLEAENPEQELNQSAPSKKAMRGLKRWRLGAIAIPVLLAVAAGATYLSKKPEAESSAESILPVATIQVESVQSYQVAQSYTGEVTSRRGSELGFERAGKLVWLGVDKGDTVSISTPIARLDISNLETQRLQLLAQKAQAVAQLEELENGPRPERIAAARATVKDLAEQLELEQIKQTRREYLYNQGAISKEQLDEVAFNANALSERLEAAKSELDELRNGTRLEQVTAQQALVRQLEAQIADLDVTIGKSTIKAPFSGTIADRIDEGTVVEAGQSVARLVEAINPEVEIGVPVPIAAQLKPGSQQQVQIGSQTYAAKVAAILPEVDPATRTRTAVLTLEPTASVAPGQIARLKVAQAIPTAGYWLPVTALVRGERGLWSCYVLVPDEGVDSEGTQPYRVQKQDVEVLHTEGDRALVRGLIEAGERIVASGTQRIVPEQLVRPTEF